MVTPILFASALLAASSPAQPVLQVRLEPVLDAAVDIAVADVRSCRSEAGFRPDSSDHYIGVWLADSVFTLDAYRYFGEDCQERLRALVSRFGTAQDTDGTIPMVFWGKEGTIDYGGRYDLAQKRKQNRDMENAYLYVHANHVLWKDFGDEGFVRRQIPILVKALESLDRRADAATGLILATYGPPNSDVSVDHAVPRTTAHVYFNVLYVQAYREFAEMAAALGHPAEAEKYGTKALGLAAAINRFLWHEDRGRYEARILRTPVTTDKSCPAFKIKEDRCFPVVDNMIAMYHHVPDSAQRTARLAREIEESERGLKLWGRMAAPAYPDGFFSKEKLFDGGNYHNGDVWTWFSNKYAIALIRMGLPSKAVDLLKRQAEVAARDKGFSEFYEDDAHGGKKGAFHLAGAASSYLQAVVEGLFGLRVDAPAGKVQIQPALLRSGEIHCRLGRHPFRVATRADEAAQTGKLTVATSFQGNGDFRFPLPATARQCRVLRGDQGEIPARVERVGKAAFARFLGDIAGDQCTFEVSWR